MAFAQSLTQLEIPTKGKGFTRLNERIETSLGSKDIEQEVLHLICLHTSCTDAVRLDTAPGGHYQLDHVVRGDTNADVLTAMAHNPDTLLERLRMASEEAIRSNQLKISEARLLMDHLESSMLQSTYLQESR